MNFSFKYRNDLKLFALRYASIYPYVYKVIASIYPYVYKVISCGKLGSLRPPKYPLPRWYRYFAVLVVSACPNEPKRHAGCWPLMPQWAKVTGPPAWG
jgi:hypothetical protein